MPKPIRDQRRPPADLTGTELLNIANANGANYWRQKCHHLEGILYAIVDSNGGSISFNDISYHAIADDWRLVRHDDPANCKVTFYLSRGQRPARRVG